MAGISEGKAANSEAPFAVGASVFTTPAHKVGATASPNSVGYFSEHLDTRRMSSAELRRAAEGFRTFEMWIRHFMTVYPLTYEQLRADLPESIEPTLRNPNLVALVVAEITMAVHMASSR